MKIHLLEHFGTMHRPASVGEILVINDRKMKVTEIEKINERTQRLTLED